VTRSDFIRAQLDAILKREGWPKYTNHPADKGGPTRGGITLATLSAWRGRPQTIEDLKALPEAEARAIYRARYIRPWDFVTDDDLFAVLIDYAVTSWHDDPTRALQEKLGVTVDSVLGPVTRAAVLRADPTVLRKYVLVHRLKKFVDLALDDPLMQVFLATHPEAQARNLRGWVNRLAEFLR
jgi:lysozyme family protein